MKPKITIEVIAINNEAPVLIFNEDGYDPLEIGVLSDCEDSVSIPRREEIEARMRALGWTRHGKWKGEVFVKSPPTLADSAKFIRIVP